MGFTIVITAIISLAASIYFQTKKETSPTAGVKSLGFFILLIVCAVSMAFGKNRTMALCVQLMFLAFSGMIYCARKQRVYANAQKYAIILFVIVIFCGGTILSMTFFSNETARLIANEMKFARAASIIMGRALAEKYSGKRALIVVNENFEKSKRQKKLVEGLKEGFDSKIKIGAVDHVKVPLPEGMKDAEGIEMIPMMEMMKAEHFDNLLAEHKDCDLVVSLVGLPYDVGEMSIWTMDDAERPQVALLFADVHNLKRAIQADYITALTYKPGVKFSEDAAPEDPRKAFELRYVILDKDNVEDFSDKLFRH
jgi:hypothetical protein